MSPSDPHDVCWALAARYDDPHQVPSLPEILKLLVTEREAATLLALPGTEQEVQCKAGEDPPFVRATLEKGFRNGMILRTPQAGGEPRYAFSAIYVDTIVGDERNNALGAEYKELWHRWTMEDRARWVLDAASDAPGRRVIPIPEMVHDHDTVLPFDDAVAIVEASRRRVAEQCPCRYRTGDCDYPVEEICLLLNDLADYAAERGYGREISREEALALLRRASESGLVHISSGEYYTSAPLGAEFICNCCPCCCGLLRPYFLSGRKFQLGTNYYAEVDADTCTGCARCEERCHFGAIRVEEGAAVVDRSGCVGCGLCAYTCEQESITLRRRERQAYVPRSSERHFIHPKE